MRIPALALALGLGLALASPAFSAPTKKTPGNGFALGVNVAWVEGKFGRDLTTAFDEDDWRRVFKRAVQVRAPVVRVWLLEGKNQEGIAWTDQGPTGLDPAFARNVRRVAAIAAEEHAQVYWTVLDGNWPDKWGRGNTSSHRLYNILNNKYGYGDLFRANVLAPLLDAFRSSPDSLYAVDLMNEVQGSVKTYLFHDEWAGARRFFRTTALFCHAVAPGVKVTASSGHHEAGDDILDGRFDGMGLDFLDVHFYTNDARVPDGADLAKYARARRLPIVIGELGQKRESVDPALQARVVRGVLDDAWRLGFSGVFLWRLEDYQPNGLHFTLFERNGAERPVATDLRRFAGAHGL